jgi:hypothetical protein
MFAADVEQALARFAGLDEKELSRPSRLQGTTALLGELEGLAAEDDARAIEQRLMERAASL